MTIATTNRFSVMNGLRAVTLMWVMFVHLPSVAVPELLLPLHSHLRFGVDFFFAISGFLVTRSLFQCYSAAERKYSGSPASVIMKKSMTEFMIRRVARIMPPYFAILATIIGIAFLTRGGLLENLMAAKQALPSFGLFYANYMIPIHLEKIPHSLFLFWSVSFQEQFYLLLAVFFVIARNNLKTLLIGASLFSILFRVASAFTFWEGLPRSAHYEFWLHLNFDGIGWGCLAWIYYDKLSALWATRGRAILTTTALLVGAWWVICYPLIWPTEKAQVLFMIIKAPIFALMVRGACELEYLSDRVSRFLKKEWVGTVGIASFEIYLLHVLIYGFLEKVLSRVGIHGGPLFLFSAYVISILMGIVFYHAFGKISQEYAKRLLRSIFLRPEAVGGAGPKIGGAALRVQSPKSYE